MPEGSAAREACIPFGDTFVGDDPPYGDPDTGASYFFQIFRKSPPCKYWTTKDVTFEATKSPVSLWPENKDPFTQKDLLNNEEDQVQELIFQIKNSVSIAYRESLANRFLVLFRDAKEEDSTSIGISVGSLRKFYNFIRLHADLKNPTISLTPDYNIYASWRGEHNRLLSVHFLPNGDVRFVIFKPNNRHPERKIRLSGAATTDTLMGTIIPNSVSDWILE